MSSKDVRAGINQARLLRPSDVTTVAMEAGMLFGLPVAMVYGIKYGIIVALAAVFCTFAFKRFFLAIAILCTAGGTVAAGLIAWKLTHDLVWTAIIAFVAFAIVGARNAACFLYNEDLENT